MLQSSTSNPESFCANRGVPIANVPNSTIGNRLGNRAVHIVAGIIAGLVVLAVGPRVSAQLRIVTYNTANSGEGQAPSSPRSGMSTILQAIGNESTGGIAKPIDVLLLQEQESSATSTQAMVNLLNGIYGPGTYARATLNGSSWGAGSPGMLYNTNSVQLVQQSTVGSLSGSGAVRQGLRYRLRPVGYDSTADFYVYNNHYKASTGATNESRRLVEASGVRNNADALGDGMHVIYAGDFNIQTSNEDMYQELLSSGNGQAFDPINRPGTWNNRSSFRDVHTQSPYNPSFNDPTLISGGMDDRFDFQLVSGEFLDNEGLSYIPGSYHVFGNNGSHGLNDYVNDPSNTAQPMNVLNALASVSDHLPVVADYQLPAAMDVSVGSYLTRVLPNAILKAPVTVANVANVVAANGADELDFLITTSGAATGMASGTDNALGGGAIQDITLDTSTPGLRTGMINVTSTSQSVMNGSMSESVSFSVLNHSNASFDSSMDQNTLEIDFAFANPCESPTETFSVSNLFTSFGAGLDLDAIFELGDVSAFPNDIEQFVNLASGSSRPFEVTFDTSGEAGTYSATFVLQTSDEDLPGVELGEGITVTVSGTIVLPGDANLDGVVDGSDFNRWNSNKFTSNGTWKNGDFNCDGFVDGSDFNSWNANKFSSLDTTVVPEPSSLFAFGILSAGLLSVCRRRKQSEG